MNFQIGGTEVLLAYLVIAVVLIYFLTKNLFTKIDKNEN